MKSKYKKTKDKLDKVFSGFIRKRDDGVCYTCGIQKHWKQMQNGHYEPRQHLGTRWCEINCHCQCAGCNVFKKGNYTVYSRKLLIDYGAGILDILYNKRSAIKKFTIGDLEELIKRYE